MVQKRSIRKQSAEDASEGLEKRINQCNDSEELPGGRHP
jgi:hypothetical protein